MIAMLQQKENLSLVQIKSKQREILQINEQNDSLRFEVKESQIHIDELIIQLENTKHEYELLSNECNRLKSIIDKLRNELLASDEIQLKLKVKIKKEFCVFIIFKE